MEVRRRQNRLPRGRRRTGHHRSRWTFRRDVRWRRFQMGLVLFVGVLAFGTTGYVVIGLTPFDAVYQTAITISTVGYGETGGAGEIDRTYRTFTLMLVLVGAATAVYTASVLLEILVEGTLDDRFRRRRMQRRINRMRGHVVVAGWGRVGRSVAAHARGHGVDVVVVDQDSTVTDDDVFAVVGDATDEDVLRAAGIERASSFIAAIGRDSDNLALTLTARSLRADLFIISRVAHPRDEGKFLRAGADRVVNPYEIGGSRMAALAFRPHVAEFLDEVIDAEGHEADIYGLVVEPGAPADGARLADLADVADATAGEGTAARDGSAGAPVGAVIAIRGADGSYVVNPPPERVLAAGEVLIAVGTSAGTAHLDAAVTARSR